MTININILNILNQSCFSKNENDKYLGTEGAVSSESNCSNTRCCRRTRVPNHQEQSLRRAKGNWKTVDQAQDLRRLGRLCSLLFGCKKRIRGKEDSLPFKRLFPHVLKKFRRMRWTRNSSVYANGEALRLLVAGWAACRPTAENSEL